MQAETEGYGMDITKRSSGSSVGSLMALYRYPVKSMQGETLTEATITERGVLGDRTYAIIDRETGYVASAKHPRKWAKLLECQATYTSPPILEEPLPSLWITLPDGTVLHSEEQETDQVLSRLFGREVTLSSIPAGTLLREANRSPVDGDPNVETIREEPLALATSQGTFFDYAPLHLLTTTALQSVCDRYPAGRFDDCRFRPNIVIATDSTGHYWLGHCLAIGNDARLQVIDPCPRCVITTLSQADLQRDPGILRTIAKGDAVASVTLAPGVPFPAVVGVYAISHHSGTIHCGDPVVYQIDD